MSRPSETILLYHRVAKMESDPWSLCVTPEHFAEHLEVLRKCCLIKLSQARSSGGIFDRAYGRVAVTFDDGYADNIAQAAPLLERHGIPATLFIVTGYVGATREFWWDELEKIIFESDCLPPTELITPDRNRSFALRLTRESARLPLYLSLYDFLQPLTHEVRLAMMDQLLQASRQTASVRPSHRMMTSDEIRKLAGNGLFEIGAHTTTHPKLSAQPIATQQDEVLGSKTWLEELIGKPVVSFAYPFGGSDHYTRSTVEVVRNSGFTYACTTAARRVEAADDPLELPRINMTDMSGEEFEKLLFG